MKSKDLLRWFVVIFFAGISFWFAYNKQTTASLIMGAYCLILTGFPRLGSLVMSLFGSSIRAEVKELASNAAEISNYIEKDILVPSKNKFDTEEADIIREEIEKEKGVIKQGLDSKVADEVLETIVRRLNSALKKGRYSLFGEE